MNRILLIRRGGLGDTLLTAPLLRALRRQHPGASLHLAGTREFCDILCAYGIVDVAHSAEDFWLWLPDRAVARLKSFDLVISDEQGCGHHVLDLHGHQTGTPYALQLARQIACEPVWPADCQLLPPVAASDAAGAAVLLAPGSGSNQKCWPKEHWLALAQRLSAADAPLEVVVGPVEIERDDPRQWPWPAAVRFVVEAEPVRLAKRLETAKTLVGNDSGTSHLAAMLGRPTVVLFRATDESVWAPVGEHVRVLGGPGQLPTVAATHAALATLGC